MKYQRIAVLGANSFSGQSFIERALYEGIEVIGYSRSVEPSQIFLPYRRYKKGGLYKFIQADINNDLVSLMTSLDSFKPEVIVDFAGQGMVAESWLNPEQWYLTNIVSKVKLHNQLRHCDWMDRYIRISTPEVYGSHNEICKENWQYSPSTPYAVSHAAIDMSLKAFHQRYDFPVIFTRYANFYGPCQQLYRIIPRTIIFGLLGKKLQLHGGGLSKRAFIYGADVADAIIRSASFGVTGESYHFSPENFMSIRQVVKIICERMNTDFETLVDDAPDRPSKDHAYLMDSSKAREKLGWRESVSFEEGVDSTVEWVKTSIKEIQRLPLNYIHKI